MSVAISQVGASLGRSAIDAEDLDGGSGIGLALCARIAGAHGAKLEITSTEHVGTTVTIAVPEVLPNEREADNDTQS